MKRLLVFLLLTTPAYAEEAIALDAARLEGVARAHTQLCVGWFESNSKAVASRWAADRGLYRSSDYSATMEAVIKMSYFI